MPLLVVGSYGGALELWTAETHKQDVTWSRCASVPDAHSAPVTSLGVFRDAFSCMHGADICVSGSSDATLQVWDLSASLARGQTISLDGAFPHDIALVRMPQHPSTTLMAVALTDRRVWLYARDDDTQPFTLRLKLEGHEDWVRALDFTVVRHDGTSMVYLASAAQDQHIRLWKIQPEVLEERAPADAFEERARELLPDDQGIQTKTHWLEMDKGRLAVSLDALLLGHDAWVTGVRWQRSESEAPAAVLVSSSVDHSVIVWSPRAGYPWCTFSKTEASHAMWLPIHRLGDVGSAHGGFLGVHWSPAHVKPCVLAYDRQGAIHVWSLETDALKWEPLGAVSGHAGAAHGLAWEPCGDYLLSTGVDRTTRLHGTHGAGSARTWHELARPQTHGYDLHAVAWLDRTTFVSAADEKVLRVFTAPQAFLDHARQWQTWQTAPNTLHIVAAEVHERAQWYQGAQLQPALDAAMEARPGSLAILAFSGMLDGCTTAWPATCSLHDVEVFLQRVYSVAWSAAVQREHLLADITVYLVPHSSASTAGARVLRQWAAAHVQPANAWVVDEPAWQPTQLDQAWPHLAWQTVRAASCDVPTVPAVSPVAMGRNVALGGTFDHLHIGHKLLLSIASLCGRDALLVGVTGEELLTKKKHSAYLSPLETRRAGVRRFVREFRSTLGPQRVTVVPIHDPCGPAATRDDLDMLILTDETAQGGAMIDEKRRENGVPPMKKYVVRLVSLSGDDEATAASKLGSTEIRAWLERRGHLPGDEARPQVAGSARVPAAHVPPLGLSNRAVDADAIGAEAEAAAPAALDRLWVHPPGPAPLLALTLWPEVEKLYGHGYELLHVSTHPRLELVASTCKATDASHAVVRLFDAAERFRPMLPPLAGHTLSVTRTSFSPDGRFLLSVSRDRSWRVFRRVDGTYVPWIGERAHARIVWDGAWSPGYGTPTFATASRDKSVKIWALDEAQEAKPYWLEATISVSDAATAVAWVQPAVLAIGLECGDVLVYHQTHDGWALAVALARHHTGAVHSLAVRPMGAWRDAADAVAPQLASAGEDGCVRLVSLLPWRTVSV